MEKLAQVHQMVEADQQQVVLNWSFVRVEAPTAGWFLPCCRLQSLC